MWYGFDMVGMEKTLPTFIALCQLTLENVNDTEVQTGEWSSFCSSSLTKSSALRACSGIHGQWEVKNTGEDVTPLTGYER